MVIDIKHCTILIRGGTFGQFIAVKLGNGNITFDEKRALDYIKDRGVLDTVREGDEQPMDVKLDAEWEYLTGTTGVITVEDAMKQRGDASTWDSSSNNTCEPYAVDIVIKDVPPCSGGGNTPETIILPDFRWESVNHDLRNSTLSFSGKCNAKQASVSRGAVQSY